MAHYQTLRKAQCKPEVDDPLATNQPGWQASTYQYSATIPHAVTSVAIENGGTNSYEYDLNGNMTCRVEGGVTFKQTYNAENRIATIQKLASGTCASPGNLTAHWAFAYDGDGTRVSTLYTPYVNGQPQTAVLTSYYMGGAYEVTGSAVKKYYAIAGMMVAVNDGTAVQYLLTDHLGSVVAVTNSSGTLTSQQRYLPFGGARSIPNSPIAGTDFTYTGQRKLDDGMGGIMDYKARFYSPYINRFLQPDSIIPNPANPQNWNRFSYGLNNPSRYTDPTGHVSCEGSNWDDGPNCLKNPNSRLSIDVAIRKYQRECTQGKHGCDDLAEAVELITSVVVEPADWAFTANHCFHGECSAWMLLGLLPFIPATLGSHADDVVDLYRAVGPGELDDILTVGKFRPDPSGMNFTNGKWFATSVVDANKWGTAFSAWTQEGFNIVKTSVPRSLLDAFHFEAKLDRIGPAYYAPSRLLEYFTNISIIK